MEKTNLNICDKDITDIYKKQATSPPKGYQAQGVSRCNPGRIPCRNCGSTERKMGAGKEPHSASLRCGECDRFIKWIGKAELTKLNKEQGGQL